jgi:S-DNA-T family DNA segregation ATPase FtsK/SpoIIIE
MRIFFTIIDDWRGQRRDLWLEAEPDASLEALTTALDDGEHQPWWEGDRLLAPGNPIGMEIRDGATLARRPPPVNGDRARPVGELRAVAGPHAGSRWPLATGHHRIGRADDAAVNLVDDHRVSRHHAELAVAPGRITVRDEGSAHGLHLDGTPITEADLAPGSLLQVGDSVLSWCGPDEEQAVVVPDGEGGLLFNRPPRMLAGVGPVTIRFPGLAPVRPGVNFPLMASIAPVILGVVMAWALHNPMYLLFTLLSPVFAISNFVSQRRGGAKTHKERSRVYRQTVGRAEHDLAAAVTAETAQRRQAFPDPAALGAVAGGPRSTLWERRRTDEDFLQVRVGLADLPALISVEGRPPPAEVTDPADDHPRLRQVPAVVHLAGDGVLGIAGERKACEALARAIVVQASVLHAPDDLAVTVLTGPHQRDAWGWARWLPHARERDSRCVARVGSTDAGVARLAGELSGLVDERLAASRTSPGAGGGVGQMLPPRAHLLVIDGSYRLGAIPAVTKVLRQGPQVGIYCICVDDAERLLPEECHAVAVLDPDRPTWTGLRTRRSNRVTSVLADLVDVGWAEEVARSLAPLRLNRRFEVGAAIPTSLRLLDLLDLEPPVPGTVAARWERDDRSTRAVIGAGDAGPLTVDLARDGPHGLVAGTTGSGKSELLQTLIASLAVANQPDLMNFVLIDYKGGSAFKDCARLPHTVGMVTDLDGHLTERALASLAAELHRRERLLAQAGAKDIEGYWRADREGLPRLSRLLIVIDEFATLLEELPNFVDGLVDLARRGRSLGIHLILATQRPSGVVSAAIKTNTNLRIAMRVTDAADSVDVIDSPLSARISKSIPGRGYVRVGHEELSEFQAARIGGRRALTGAAGLVVHDVGWADLGVALPEPERPALAEDATDLSELVTAICGANDSLGLAPPVSPWLEPLPEKLVLDLEADADDAGAGAGSRLDARGARLGAAFGTEDRPGEQARRPAFFDVERDGHLLAVGDPGSGRTTWLRTLAGSLCAQISTRDLHLFGVDCGNGGLVPIADLPNCGAVVSRREPDRVDRLLTKLMAEVTRRQQVLAQGGFATIADQRAVTSTEERLPYVVILLDRWEGYNAEFETIDNGRLVSTFLHLMREGPGVGVRVVVTGDRSATSARFSSLIDRILMLRCNDRTTYSMVGLNPRHLPELVPTGRAFDARSGVELQIALLHEDTAGPAQVGALRQLAKRTHERDALLPEAARPEPVAVLPAHVGLAAVLAGGGPAGAAGGEAVAVALVGVGGDRMTPQRVDLTNVGPGFVVAGPPRSGRSNTLVVMARTLARRGCTLVAVTARPSPLAALRDEPQVAAVLDGRATTATDLDALLSSLAGGPAVVLVDDAELLSDSPISDALTGFVRAARDRSSALILGGTTTDLGGFRGFIPEVRKSRAGLLLCPSAPGDGDLLGARLPRTAVFAGPPGRGVLVAEWEMQIVQVPFDDTGP